MARTQTMVQLSDDLVRLLDAEASRCGISRSALIRSVLERFLAAQVEADVARRIVDGYRRVPQDTPDEWGDLGLVSDSTRLDVLVRLDAEERADGNDPW